MSAQFSGQECKRDPVAHQLYGEQQSRFFRSAIDWLTLPILILGYVLDVRPQRTLVRDMQINQLY